MIELLKIAWQTAKVIFFEWFPAIAELEAAAWGPLASLKEAAGTIAAIIAVITAIVKFLRKYGMD